VSALSSLITWVAFPPFSLHQERLWGEHWRFAPADWRMDVENINTLGLGDRR
jgi:hypothetical protein